MKHSTIFAGALVSALACATMPAQAASDYPNRPVEMVVGYPAGGSVDVLARLLQPHMSRALGQPVVVENRPGAGSNIGTAAVARAAPDGYRILLAANNGLTINPHLYTNPGFDVFDNLAPAALLAASPVAIVARSDLGIDSVPRLIEHARRHPDKATYGTPGIGSPMHLLGESINQEAEVSLVHVPYKGSGQALTDLVGGNVDVVISTLAAVQPFLRNDKVTLVALAEEQPFPGASQVPLVKDTLAGVVAPGWFALMVPRGTPEPIIARLHDAAMQALAAPDVRTGMEAGAMVPLDGDSAMLASKMRQEYDYFEKVVAQRGIPRN